MSKTLVVLFALLLVGEVGVYHTFKQRTQARAEHHLETMLMLRASALGSYLESTRSELVLWSGRGVVKEMINFFQAEFEARGNGFLSESGAKDVYSVAPTAVNNGIANESVDERVKRFVEHHGYHDIFFINPRGDILYTAAKEDDIGTNLVDGPYAQTGLGRVFNAALEMNAGEHVAFEDFSLYPPSNNEPAAFIASAVYQDGEFLGVYAVQISVDSINQIMQFSSGMGDSGETYLVGQDGLMRSTSRFSDTSTVLQTSIESPSVARALEGETGIGIVDDYRGIPVLSAFRRFEFEGISWAVLAEQDVSEVLEKMPEIRNLLIAGFVICLSAALLLRNTLVKFVLPAWLAAFFGLALLSDADD